MNTTPTVTTATAPLRCPSHAVSRARQENRATEWRTMIIGPHLDFDGYTLIVPSEWYNKTAVTCWRQYGFEFDKDTATWKRDTRLPLLGKRYTAEVWLESTRRQFFEFWPALLGKCERCGKQFARTNQYQTFCNGCEAERQAAHNRHFHN